MKKLLFIGMLVSQSFLGQETTSKYNQSVDIRGDLSIVGFDFNFNDFYFAFSGGIEDIGYQWGARLNFQFRPFHKKVQLPVQDGIVYQYKEQKYFFSLDLDKRFGHISLWNAHTQFFAGAKNGILWGNYKGTKNDVPGKFVVAPMGGICFNFDDSFFIKLGYLYFDEGLSNVPDSKVTFALHFIL